MAPLPEEIKTNYNTARLFEPLFLSLTSREVNKKFYSECLTTHPPTHFPSKGKGNVDKRGDTPS